jgi:hypothetical protein
VLSSSGLCESPDLRPDRDDQLRLSELRCEVLWHSWSPHSKRSNSKKAYVVSDDRSLYAAERAAYPAGVGLQSRCLAVNGQPVTSVADSATFAIGTSS